MARLTVPSDIDHAGARDLAARLAEQIATAPTGAVFHLDLSACTESVLAIQIAEACRKTLDADSRLGSLGPAAAAALEPGFAPPADTAPADSTPADTAPAAGSPA